MEPYADDAGGGVDAASTSPTTVSNPQTSITSSPTPDAGMAADSGDVSSPDMGVDADAAPDMGAPDMRPEPGTIVEFTIEEGTGSGAWNSREEAVVLYVGQILRLTNLDSRDHQLHAGDDAPVDHGNRLVPGQSQDLEVESPMELGSLYDHNDGRSAEFWLEARE